MTEQAGQVQKLDQLREEALARSLSRRAVLQRGIALGLAAPALATLLAACGGDDDEDPTATSAASEPTATTGQAAASPTGDTAEPTATTGDAAATSATPEPAAASPTTAAGVDGPQRGQDELLRLLFWQAPTILNPHLATGDKDTVPARVCLEPLLDFGPDGELVPILAAEVPSLENGQVAADGMSVTYTLKPDVVWSDGTPFTAEDVRFTWEYVTDPATPATTVTTYTAIASIDVVDDLTVTLNFAEPNPAWFSPFVGGYSGWVLPRHLLEEFVGETAGDAPFNLLPVGTGAFKVTEFVPGDYIIFELNELYREPNQPYFQRIEYKGGGDAASAGRAVLQTDETDFAWNLQVEKAILDQLKSGENGVLDVMPWISVEQIWLNFADPNSEVDGARSQPTTQHPYLSDPAVRQALAISIDREVIAAELWGEGGAATPNFLVVPERFVSPDAELVFDPEQANQTLDEAGWVLDGDVRAKDGVELRGLFQTTTNAVRNKTQEIVKQAWGELGLQLELKSIDSSVYFSTDAGNPDTSGKFYADFQMHSTGGSSPYPITFMARFKSTDPASDLSQESNSWTGRNVSRWVNEEYNELWLAAQTELDTATQDELFIGMSNLALENVVVIPLIHRALVAGVSTRLRGLNRAPLTTDLWNIQEWYFEE